MICNSRPLRDRISFKRSEEKTKNMDSKSGVIAKRSIGRRISVLRLSLRIIQKTRES